MTRGRSKAWWLVVGGWWTVNNTKAHRPRPVGFFSYQPPTTIHPSQLLFADLHRWQQAHRLVERLLAFVGRHAVGHDARARLQVHRLTFEHHRPQGDAGVHVAAEVHIADRPAVGAAP